MTLLDKFKRYRYRKAMFKAMAQSRREFLPYKIKNTATTSDALRTIKHFEKANNVVFNPFYKSHVGLITGMARRCRFIRRYEKTLKHIRKTNE